MYFVSLTPSIFWGLRSFKINLFVYGMQVGEGGTVLAYIMQNNILTLATLQLWLFGYFTFILD